VAAQKKQRTRKKKAIDQKANNILFAVAPLLYSVCCVPVCALRERERIMEKKLKRARERATLFIYFVCEPFHLFAQMAEWQNIWTIWQNT
jgi:hypothetical protein